MSQQLNNLTKTVKLDVLDTYDELKIVKDKTGVNPSVIALAIIVFLLICLIGSNQAVTFVLAIGCYLIPAYFSFVALESPQIQDDIKYLNYWIIFAILEMLAPIISLFMQPFYYGLTRLILTMLFLHPSINLAGKIYHQVIQPKLIQNESLIDKKFENLGTMINQRGQKIINQNGKKIAEQLKQINKNVKLD